MRWRISGRELHVMQEIQFDVSAQPGSEQHVPSPIALYQRRNSSSLWKFFGLAENQFQETACAEERSKIGIKKGGPFSYLQVGFAKHSSGNVMITVLVLLDIFCEAKYTTNWRALQPTTKLLLALDFHFKRNTKKPTFGSRISSQSLSSPYSLTLIFKKCLPYPFQ